MARTQLLLGAVSGRNEMYIFCNKMLNASYFWLISALSGDSDKVTAHLSQAHKILLNELLMLEPDEEVDEEEPVVIETQ